MSRKPDGLNPIEDGGLPFFDKIGGKLKRIRFRLVSMLPAEEPEEGTVYNGKPIPVCPRCGDFVYYRKQCIHCGQRFTEGSRTIGEVMDDEHGF